MHAVTQCIHTAAYHISKSWYVQFLLRIAAIQGFRKTWDQNIEGEQIYTYIQTLSQTIHSTLHHHSTPMLPITPLSGIDSRVQIPTPASGRKSLVVSSLPAAMLAKYCKITSIVYRKVVKGAFLIFLRCFRTCAKTCQLGPLLHNSCKDSIFEVHLRNGKQLIRARSSWGVPGVAFCKKCCATLRKASWGHSMNQSSDHLH